MADPIYPYYEPGGRLTAQATGTITAGRCVKVSGNRVSGPALNEATDGGNYRVAQAGNQELVLGIAENDAVSGGKLGVICDPGMIVPVTAGAAIVAGAKVMSDANGKVVTATAGANIVGIAMTAASGADVAAEIKLGAGGALLA